MWHGGARRRGLAAVGARGSARVRGAAHAGAQLRTGARLGRREALRGLWCGGARAVRALAWRHKGGMGLQR
jgi:hypothetical protein